MVVPGSPIVPEEMSVRQLRQQLVRLGASDQGAEVVLRQRLRQLIAPPAEDGGGEDDSRTLFVPTLFWADNGMKNASLKSETIATDASLLHVSAIGNKCGGVLTTEGFSVGRVYLELKIDHIGEGVVLGVCPKLEAIPFLHERVNRSALAGPKPNEDEVDRLVREARHLQEFLGQNRPVHVHNEDKGHENCCFWGLHSDGTKRCTHGESKYTDKLSDGDCVGILMDWEHQGGTLSFFVNGVNMGIAYRSVSRYMGKRWKGLYLCAFLRPGAAVHTLHDAPLPPEVTSG